MTWIIGTHPCRGQIVMTQTAGTVTRKIRALAAASLACSEPEVPRDPRDAGSHRRSSGGPTSRQAAAPRTALGKRRLQS